MASTVVLSTAAAAGQTPLDGRRLEPRLEAETVLVSDGVRGQARLATGMAVVV